MLSSPRTRKRLPPSVASTSVERNSITCPARTSSSIVCLISTLSASVLDPPGALAHLEGAGVGIELEADLPRNLADVECRLPGGDLDHQVVAGLGGRTAPAR